MTTPTLIPQKISPASLTAPNTATDITFTRFTGPPGSRCTKSFELNAEGELLKDSAPQFGRGKAETVALKGLDKLPDFLDGLSNNECISSGVFDQRFCPVLTQRALTPEKESEGYRARSKQHMTEPDCGLLLIDYDPNPDMPKHLQCNSVTDVMEKLIAAIPELKQVGYVGSTSSSAGLYNSITKEPYSGGGFHIYFTFQGVKLSDIKRLLEIRLWNAGLGYIGFARNGAMLKRTLIDLAVFSPERLIFEAIPTLGDNLAQAPRKWVCKNGLPISSRLTVSANEEVEYKQQVDAALSSPANIERSLQLKQSYTNEKASEYARVHGVTNDEARKLISKQLGTLTPGNELKLYADHPLEVEGSHLTVGELLKQGHTYDGQYMPDPIEGSEYGASTAIFNFNGGRRPRITSFAHGQTTIYLLSEFGPLQSVVATTSNQNRSDGDPKNKSSNLLAAFSLNGKGAELLEQMKNDEFVLPEIAIKGQATLIYAQFNTGKTLLLIHLLAESAKVNNINLENVCYINADDTYKGMVEKLQIAEEAGFQMLCPGHEGFHTADLIPTIKKMIATQTASDAVVIVDTMKKFIDPMSKSDSRQFGIIMREFVSQGGTYIALAHTNKKRGNDGKPVFGGVSDPVDDADCAFILDTLETTDEYKIVEFANFKSRGNVANRLAFEYSNIATDSYSARLASVKEVDPTKAEQHRSSHSDTGDEELITAISKLIADGTNTKMKLADAAAKATGLSKRKAMGVIENYTGQDLALHKWHFIRGKKGANIFSLNTPESVPKN